MSSDVHHEVEMIVALKSGGSSISVSSANQHIFGYGIGFDMTRRDLQHQAKKWAGHGRWVKHSSNPPHVGELHPIETTGVIEKGKISLHVMVKFARMQTFRK